MKKFLIFFALAAVFIFSACSADTLSFLNFSERSENNSSPSGERNIYVGDIISLEFPQNNSVRLNKKTLEDAFDDFEIVELKEANGNFYISVRTFVTGEHRVALGGAELTFDVKSTLDYVENDGFFEGENSILKSAPHINILIPLCVSAGLFLFSGGFLLFKKFVKHKIIRPDPYKQFIKKASSLSQADENFFVDLTFHLKRYFENLYGRKIIGKTSDEIAGELAPIQSLAAALDEIRGWLYECDRFKFTGAGATAGEISSHYESLLRIAEKIRAGEAAA